RHNADRRSRPPSAPFRGIRRRRHPQGRAAETPAATAETATPRAGRRPSESAWALSYPRPPFRQSRPGHRADRLRVQTLLIDKRYPWGCMRQPDKHGWNVHAHGSPPNNDEICEMLFAGASREGFRLRTPERSASRPATITTNATMRKARSSGTPKRAINRLVATKIRRDSWAESGPSLATPVGPDSAQSTHSSEP